MDRLSALIAGVRRRWFAAAALRIAGLSMAAAAVPLLVGLAAYWVLGPSGGPLLALALGAVILAVLAAVLVSLRIEPRPGDVRVARFIEERVEALPGARPMDDCVVSAVQASSMPNGEITPLAPLVVQAAVKRLDGIDPGAIVPSGVIRRSAVIAGGGTLLLAVTLAVGMPALLHAVETARVRFFPTSVSVEVLPGDARVVAGRPLTIRARVHAGGAPLGRIPPMLVVTAGDAQQTVQMVPTDDGFTFDFESIDRSFSYKVSAGAATSQAYSVTALFAPRVTRIDLDYEYPSFSGLAPRTQEDGGDIYAPTGTRVHVRIHADKPVVSGQLAMAKASPALRSAGDRVLEADLVVQGDDAYRISLVDRDGLSAADDSEYFIRVMQDRPPDVRVLRPASDQGITPLQEVAIEARADDDYGVASLDLVYSVAGGPERRVPFARTSGTATERSGAHLLAAEELRVRPGDVIAYYAVARDVGRGRPSTTVKSDLFFLEVKPFNEEFEAAQSQASGAGAAGDPQLESLIEAQKDIINATWNIERRSNAGRSTDDVQAIAKAQADLKIRAERVLAGPRGRRGREPVPQRIAAQAPQPSANANPVASAVEAMTRAVEQLASDRTRDAIPHEMAALQGLLQAQAEVRRRQIAQQQARGGGAGNRQSQDLSALFDKELQRQQQTNYEQRSQVEERQDQQQGNDQELLDRIRDLAQRQEELNRQQQEAARQQAEERKRQLERLAREQQELQRQVEALSRQMTPQSPQGQQQQGQQQGQQQSGQQGQQQGSPQGQSQGQRSGANAAIDQMRRAADEMRRENSEAAARSGQRAADELRTLEQRLRGGGADARQRAAADLQAEAQQVAQEQRRIAAEAERMEKNGEAGSTDARRRLAADKDRLADRVDGLRREAERLGAGTKPGGDGADTEPARARNAAAELGKQRVGERMREGAQQLRDGSKPASGQAEQQIAQALERVVEQLGGGASADARRLADQLDRSRATRERLDALEAQLREAEARGDRQADKLREQYRQELARARESFQAPPGSRGEPAKEGQQLGGRQAQEGSRGGTPEQQEASHSAPGTEAFKQDRSEWASLRKSVDRALEQHDADVSRRLARALGEDRLNAGGSERIPEHYRRLVAKYYESLAKVKK